MDNPLTEIERLALRRAEMIIEAWWWEDQGEFQDENNLSDAQMDEINKVPFCIALNRSARK